MSEIEDVYYPTHFFSKTINRNLFILNNVLTPKYILDKVSLPTDWELVSKGQEEQNRKTTKRIYFVINSPDDIISIIVFLNLKAENCSMDAGWELKKTTYLGKHKVILTEHPGGDRKQYIWYCPKSEATFMINFSSEPDKIWRIFSKIQCH